LTTNPKFEGSNPAITGTGRKLRKKQGSAARWAAKVLDMFCNFFGGKIENILITDFTYY